MTAHHNFICILCLCAIWTIIPGCHEEDPPGDILAENLGNESLILLPGSFSEDAYRQSSLPAGTADIIELGEEVVATPTPVDMDQEPETTITGSKWERIFRKAADTIPAEGNPDQPDTDGPDGEQEPER